MTTMETSRTSDAFAAATRESMRLECQAKVLGTVLGSIAVVGILIAIAVWFGPGLH